jgi:hypothetical protein
VILTDATRQAERRRHVAFLIGSAILSICLWQTSIGSMVLYPFTILATWFHEMGHGLAAMVTGSSFDRLLIYADGSGMALSTKSTGGWGLTRAFTAACGPLGPAVAGSLMILSSRRSKDAGTALGILSAALIASTAIWVRSPVGLAVLPAIGLCLLAVAAKGSESTKRIAAQFIGVQACVSAWGQLDYLFSPGGSVGGELHRSDTGAMADALFLPYWFWGTVVSAGIAWMLWASLKSALKR